MCTPSKEDWALLQCFRSRCCGLTLPWCRCVTVAYVLTGSARSLEMLMSYYSDVRLYVQQENRLRPWRRFQCSPQDRSQTSPIITVYRGTFGEAQPAIKRYKLTKAK